MGLRGRQIAALAGIVTDAAQWLGDIFARSGAAPFAYGRRNERIAARHLRWRGYRIVARNFKAAGAEIDLVALDGDTLVFVEVKARRSLAAGRPEEAVHWHKQRQIRRAADMFARRSRVRDRPVRFDIVAITGEGRGRQIEILRDAF